MRDRYEVVTISTPVRGGAILIETKNATIQGITKCRDQYIESKGSAITRGFPIPCKVGYLYNRSKSEIETIEILSYETNN